MKKAIMFLLAVSALDRVEATNTGQELIVNGNFAANDCSKDWCIFKGGNCVKNWTPKPQIQIGFGKVYNSRLGRQRVIELAPNANTCIEQNVRNLQPGIYQLKYEWAARQGRSFADCQFRVEFNDRELKHITPCDYNINTDVIQFEVKAGCDGRVEFCGIGGQNNSYGAIIKSVSLIRKGNLPVIQPPVVQPPVVQPPVVQPPVVQPPVVQPPNGNYPLPPFGQPPNINFPPFGQPPNINLPPFGQPPSIDLPPFGQPSSINFPSFGQPPNINLPPISQPPNINFPPFGQPPNINLPPFGQPPINLPPFGQPPSTQPPAQDPSKITLDSHSGKCLQRQYKLGTGKIEISFDYKVFAKVALKESAIYVTLNGKPIYKVLPCDDGKNIKVPADAIQGTYTVGFCTVGSPNEPNHQVSISNVIVTQQQCIASLSTDLIVNGGFEQNQCGSDWCIWNQHTGVGKVTGWQPSPQIEVGKGTVYNQALGNGWVAELDPNANTCIRQRLVLRPGRHILQFNWAGRSGISAQSNEFEVKLNGKALKSLRASNYQVNQEEIIFDLSDCPQDSWLEFCGTGKSDSYGALIDNVKLFRSESCATTKVVRY